MALHWRLQWRCNSARLTFQLRFSYASVATQSRFIRPSVTLQSCWSRASYVNVTNKILLGWCVCRNHFLWTHQLSFRFYRCHVNKVLWSLVARRSTHRASEEITERRVTGSLLDLCVPPFLSRIFFFCCREPARGGGARWSKHARTLAT